MGRLVFGLIKGLIVGAGVGYGAWRLGLGGGLLGYVSDGVIGFLVGVVCGKPLWKQDTLWTPVLKGVFGFLIAAGLTWVAHRVVGGLRLPLPAALGLDPATPVVDVPFLLGPVVGGVYGAFVEVDDGGNADKASTKKKS